MLSGCGLPTFFFLGPPLESVRSPAPPRYFFDHNPENDSEEFDGYDIWYKLYPLEIDGFNAEARASADRQAIDRDPPAVGPSRLQARNFTRIVSIRQGTDAIFDRQAPALPLDPGSARLTFQLDFGPGEDLSSDPVTAEITLSRFFEDPPTPLTTPVYRLRRRNRPDEERPAGVAPGDYYDSFWNSSRYRSREQDQVERYSEDIEFSIPTDGATNGPGPLLIVLYVIAVGTDPVNLNRVYSEATQIIGNDLADGIRIQPR